MLTRRMLEQLPSDPAELLTHAQHKEMSDRLAELARIRRNAENMALGMIMSETHAR